MRESERQRQNVHMIAASPDPILARLTGRYGFWELKSCPHKK